MTDPRLRVLEIVGEVLECAPDMRGAVFDHLCGDDEVLRREVTKLIALDGKDIDFLGTPPLLADETSADPELGRRIDHYRIIELLGRGGMAAVYRAAREHDYEQHVAIKLIRRDLTLPAALRRFHAERQILARFDHPSIARLFDGGTTEDGRPYLVMEWIDGRPLTTYCAEQSVSMTDRLKLFLQVLSAVAYAHRHLVVHRDLKPANILVTREGVPKLLDFGIAKMLDPEVSRVTVSGPGLMTPRYAAPEQIDGLPITTATDVYCLGVLLYELLVGRLPCGLETCTPHEIAGRICTEEPIAPSRDTSDRKLRRGLAGDLDAIALKALCKDPSDRYSSVELFAEDLRRHLEGLPVLARRDVWLYRTVKLLQRHRLAALVVALIFASSLVSTSQWLRAKRERNEAILQQNRSERVTRVITKLIRSANPDVARGRELTAREILEEGREQIVRVEQSDPELAAMLAGTLGDVYRNLGHYPDALALLNRAVELRRAIHPEGHERLAIALNDLGSAHYYLEDGEQAARLFREALDMRRLVGQEPAAIARGLSNLASAQKLRGAWDEAAQLYKEALAIREQLFGPDAPEIATSLYALGVLDFEIGKLESAEQLLRRALAIRTKKYGPQHTRVATVESSLGRVLLVRDELQEAEEMQRRALATRAQLLDEGHVAVAVTQRDLAAVLLNHEDPKALDEGRLLIDRAIVSLRASQSSGDWALALAENVLSGYLAAVGKENEARALHGRSCETLVAAKGERSIYVREACAPANPRPLTR